MRRKKIKSQFASKPKPVFHFKEKFKEILDGSDCRIKSYDEYKDLKQVAVVVELGEIGDVTFEMLASFSDILGTRKLNFTNPEVVNEGCGTCGDGFSKVISIFCKEVKFPDENL